MGAAEAKTEVTLHKFGSTDLSDVVLVAKDHEFHCHKMMLAARSDYFRTLFYSTFKEKDQKRIDIDVNPLALKSLLEILYIGYSRDIQELMDCCSGERLGITNDVLNRRLWHAVNDVLSLADRLLLTDIVLHSVQYTFMLHHGKCHDAIVQGTCSHCATKLIIAMHHRMNKYKDMSVSKQRALACSLDRLKEIRPNFSASDMSFLLSRPFQ